MASQVLSKKLLSQAVLRLLTQRPGQSVKELAIALKVNRQFLSGYLTALEESGAVSSRRVGPARIYFKSNGGR